MPYYTTIPSPWGAGPVTILKNPTKTELASELGRAETARAWIVGADVLVWCAGAALHTQVLEVLQFGRNAIPVILYFAPGSVGIMVTDASRFTNHHHSPHLAEMLRTHPYF